MSLDEMLSKLNLTYEDLTVQERETYQKWLKVLDTKPVTVEDIKLYVKQMRETVELKLVDMPEFTFIFGIFKVVNREQVGLKARLKNYLLLESFMESRERAKQSLEKQIENTVTSRFTQ